MERNGASNRIRGKIGVRLALIAGSYLLLVFVTLTMEHGTIPDLSGRANLIDYATVDGWGLGAMGTMEKTLLSKREIHTWRGVCWSEHGPLVAVYMIGDLGAIRSAKSFEVNGNQTTICARDIGILLGLWPER